MAPVFLFYKAAIRVFSDNALLMPHPARSLKLLTLFEGELSLKYIIINNNKNNIEIYVIINNVYNFNLYGQINYLIEPSRL